MNMTKASKMIVLTAVALSVSLPVRAADGYSCSLRVGNSTAAQTISEGNGKRKSGRVKQSSKTVSRVVTWPVSGSVRGEPAPSAKDVKLMCYFIGTTDGKATMLGTETKNVALDEKGNFKLDVSAPADKLVHTTTVTKSRGRRRGGRSGSTKSTTSGTRVTGCIIQLLVKDKVERAYASNSGWGVYAKKHPLSEEDILKIR